MNKYIKIAIIVVIVSVCIFLGIEYSKRQTKARQDADLQAKNQYCLDNILNGLNNTRTEQNPLGLLYINGIKMKGQDGKDVIGQLILQPVNFIPNK